MVSHLSEMLDYQNNKNLYHGEQIAISTISCLEIQDKIINHKVQLVEGGETNMSLRYIEKK